MLKKISSFQIIILCFAAVIFLGAFLLCLPIASKAGEWTNFLDALFTATSATCVTGLVVVDTQTHWALFGQIVIICLIQIGGLGIITIFVYILSLVGNKLSIKQRTTMQDAISAPNISGIVPLTKFIFITTFVIEIIGAVCLMPLFIKDKGVGNGIWYSFFHSVSAFCNAGFDLMGNFKSLTDYSSNVLINIVIPLLIVIGGLSFFTWYDFKQHKFNFKKYTMQTKAILTTTLILIVLPATYFFFFEFNELDFKERLLVSIFQAITPRTAGFNTYDLASMSESSIFITIILMLIGAAPSSTGGGMKVTTVVVIVAAISSLFFRRSDTHIFKRRIANSIILNALAIFSMYIVLVIVSAVIISKVENLPMLTCLFETSSAIATVGLTLGITTSLGTVSKVIIIFLMFFGRIGGLTLIFAAMSNHKVVALSKFPQENIIVG